ncbi:MAG: DUF202 domain-containing protein [candidate division KSB1 bacterium]|nr:DUF202 domain-containing protein [candidate division KSB1 bacterium]MDQ7064378.1 DUF202 domain-containing protein [candidate division KSB1 bacterium]
MYYKKFRKQDLILRDLLAVDRTVLANERTLLAYARTALTLFIAGVSFIHFYPARVLYWIGWGFVPVAALVLYTGFRRFMTIKQNLEPLTEVKSKEKDPPQE